MDMVPTVAIHCIVRPPWICPGAPACSGNTQWDTSPPLRHSQRGAAVDPALDDLDEPQVAGDHGEEEGEEERRQRKMTISRIRKRKRRAPPPPPGPGAGGGGRGGR